MKIRIVKNQPIEQAPEIENNINNEIPDQEDIIDDQYAELLSEERDKLLKPKISVSEKEPEQTFNNSEVEIHNKDYLVNDFLLKDEELDLQKITTYYNENKIKLTFRMDENDPSKKEIIKINDIPIEDINARVKILEILKELDRLEQDVKDNFNNLQIDWDAPETSVTGIKNKPNVFTKEGGTILGDVNIDGTLNMTVDNQDHRITGLADPITASDAVNLETLSKAIEEQYFEKSFTIDDWRFIGGYYYFDIKKEEHGRGDKPQVESFEREYQDPDGDYFINIDHEYRIRINGTIRFYSNEPFNGRLVLKNLVYN